MKEKPPKRILEDNDGMLREKEWFPDFQKAGLCFFGGKHSKPQVSLDI